MDSAWIAVLMIALGAGAAAASSPPSDPMWQVLPTYQSPAKPTSLVVFDHSGKPHELYSESEAILILEGRYQSPAFPSVTSAADRAEALLKERLERRNFHVLIWHDLSGSQLRDILEKAFSVFGHRQTSRIFFYYFGHGKLIDTQAYLVPVDAPDPLKDLQGFYNTALPIRRLRAYAEESIEVRHAFFAFEACQAGSVVTSLAGLGTIKVAEPAGYLLTKDILNPIRQFLTAGNDIQEIPADNSFTSLLAAGLSEADVNNSGYVTGTEIINFVRERMPQLSKTYKLTPESGSIPEYSGGDFVFGPVEPNHTVGQRRPLNAAVSTGASIMTLTQEQLIARVHQTSQQINDFYHNYQNSMAELDKESQTDFLADAMRDTRNHELESTESMHTVLLRTEIAIERREKFESQWQLSYVPEIKELRAELIRRGSSQPNTVETAQQNKAVSDCVDNGSLTKPEALKTVADYLEQLGQGLPPAED
jgi:hypothetical protein